MFICTYLHIFRHFFLTQAVSTAKLRLLHIPSDPQLIHVLPHTVPPQMMCTVLWCIQRSLPLGGAEGGYQGVGAGSLHGPKG